jgi:hypothetical protein
MEDGLFLDFDGADPADAKWTRGRDLLGADTLFAT